MYISAKAAAESLNTYQSFKDQLLPNIKKGNVAVLYPQGFMLDQQQNIGILKRSKRSKTSFDSHNNSRTSSSATGTNSTIIQEQINRSRRTSRCGGFSRKASKSGDCTPFISIDQNVVSKPQIIKKSLRTLNIADQCYDENYPHSKLPSATTKSHITLIDLEDSSRIKKLNDPLPIERQPKQNTRQTNLSVVDVQAPTVSNTHHHHPVLSQQTNRAYQQLMQDTNHDLNGLLLSIYDQSDNKSQTCNTATAENQLREENMQLRMEIIKLKKALFMKSQNNGNLAVLEKSGADQMLLRNHLEPRDEGAASKQPQMTPLTRVVIEDICEEGVSSYSHEDLPRMGNSHMTFKQIQQSNSRQYDPEAVVTFQPRNHNQSAQALEDLEQMLRDQGIEVREELMRNPKDFLLTDERKGLSSVFEQKRHYEQEIEVLKKDLEVIETEETKIKQRLSEQSSLLLESIKMERGQMKDKGQRQSREGGNQIGQINVAFDSFIEKRSNNQPKFLPVASSIDKFSMHCISDDGVMPTVSINHQNLSVNNQHQNQWFPPSFSNSLFPSLAVSPVSHLTTNNNIPPLKFPQQHQIQQPVKSRGRRCRYSQRNHQSSTLNIGNDSNDASSPSQQEDHNQQQQQVPVVNNGQTSSRLNTDMIDQMFEDPKLQSQFQCLDNDQPIISLLSIGHEFPKKKTTNIDINPQISQSNDQNSFIHKKPQELQEQQQPQKLKHIKQTLKGVLQTYEQSFQKNNNNQVKHFIGDGTESKYSPKKEFGIPRLSTIKEDSPEFGPFTENSDIVNHSSILRNNNQMQINNSHLSSNYHTNPCEMCQHRQNNTSGHRSNAPSFELQSQKQFQQQQQQQQQPLIKKNSQIKMVKQAPKSPMRPTQSANQIKGKKCTTNFIKITKSVVQQHPHISRSSSPYNTNQVSNIVNQAYKDIIKRKQREAQEISYISTRTNQQIPMTYAGLAQMTQHKKNMQMKNNKVLGVVTKKPKKAKENIKFLSNVVTKMQGSRNIQQNKVLSSNINQSTSAVSSYSFISAKANQPRTPISHPRSLSNQSKQQRPSPIAGSNLHCIEEQYDLLWSKQVTQKRISLLKKKEEAAKLKYQEKIAKIESIQRKKAIEIEERKNKSKSPSNYVATTTMSEFECTPYHGGAGIKLTFDKGQYVGYNTVQPPTMIPSTSTRSPQLPSTPLVNDYMKANYQNIYSKPSQPVSIAASGITTNLISQQNSAGKPIIRSSRTPEVAKGTSTPVTVNKNYWDNNPELSSEDQRWLAAGAGDLINSSANTTAIVTAINGMNYENLGNLRQQVLPFHSQMGSPLQNQHFHNPVSIRHTLHHSRSNSGQKIATEKRVCHKKQSSLSNPKTLSATNIDMQPNIKQNDPRFIIQKKPENDLMRKFLSNNQTYDHDNLRSGSHTMKSQNSLYKPSLFQLHPVKYDGNGQVKTLPLNNGNGNSHHQMRLLEPIFEDY